MKGLGSLIRLSRFMLDERRKELGLLLSQASALEDERRRLDALPAEEQPVVEGNAQLGVAVGGFVAGLLAKKRTLADTKVKLEGEIAQAQAAVAAAFAEFKRYEIAAEKLATEESQRAARVERAELDEIALENHRRENTQA